MKDKKMKINPEILKNLFIDIYQHYLITCDENQKKEINKTIYYLEIEDNIKEYGFGKDDDIFLSLKDDDEYTVCYNILISSYISYIKLYREQKLKRILK